MSRPIPQDLWKEVFLWLESKNDYSSVSQVCKSWYKVVNDENFLKQIMLIRFGLKNSPISKKRDLVQFISVALKFQRFEPFMRWFFPANFLLSNFPGNVRVQTGCQLAP